jgi:hypothetical protein
MDEISSNPKSQSQCPHQQQNYKHCPQHRVPLRKRLTRLLCFAQCRDRDSLFALGSLAGLIDDFFGDMLSLPQRLLAGWWVSVSDP